MGLLDRLSGRPYSKGGIVPVNEKPVASSAREMVGAEEANDAAERIAQAMKKSLTYAGYVAWDNADDQGGYFGPEFDIRSSAGRIKALYSREPWIYITATRVAKTISSIPFKAYAPNGGDEIPNHPIAKIFNSGTQGLSGFETNWTAYLDLMLGGNYFLILDPTLKKIDFIAPVELVNLNLSTDFKSVESIDVYSMGSRQDSVRIPMNQVIQPKLPNPYGQFYGMSPFTAAARPILLDRYKNEYEMAFYLRGATYGGVVETTEDLGKSRFQRMMRTFESSHTGRANWWRTLFLPKGATWKASTQTMKDMEHLEGLKENRLTILATMGIPPSIVGLTEDVNKATSEAQERIYWNDTIVPLANFIASGWNNSYLVKTQWKAKVELRPDFTGIEAVEGFTAAKTERAKSMEPYFLIDEIRKTVWNVDPIPDGRGDKFVAEVKAIGPSAPLALSSSVPVTKDLASIPEGFEVICLICDKSQFTKDEASKWATENGFMCTDLQETSDSYRMAQVNPDMFDEVKTVVLRDGVKADIGSRKGVKAAEFLRAKASTIGSQNRIESTLGSRLAKAVDVYIVALLDDAAKALREKRNVKEYLKAHQDDRMADYMVSTRDIYAAGLERGFTLAFSQVKVVPTGATKRTGFPGLSETDRQAADILRERSRDGRRKVLYERAIERFQGFDANRTDAVIGIIEQGYRDGEGFEEIARSIRDKYDESYRNQARTIVRTEILSAVSAGLDWNHKVLTEIFTEVLKEWMHQGDENKDARQEHIELDGTTVRGDGSWTVVDPGTGQEVALSYPRDPDAPAGQVINCFPGTIEASALDISNAFQRFYDGPMITVNFKSGAFITGTPNHPVLTPKGWVGLGKLAEGDQVFKASGVDSSLAHRKNVKHVEAALGKVFSSFLKSNGSMRVDGRSGDFHGDGTTENIDIINTDSGLHDRGKPGAFKMGVCFSLPETNLTHSGGLGDSGEFKTSSWIGVAHGSIGPGNLPHLSGMIESRPLQDFGIGSTARSMSGIFEVPNQSDSWNAKHPLDLIHGEFLNEVQMDDVIGIDVGSFRGHVYNLQTKGEWYLANKFISHNCRCSMASVIPDTATSNAESIVEQGG